jgi:hypothetical protein
MSKEGTTLEYWYTEIVRLAANALLYHFYALWFTEDYEKA